MGTHQQNIAPVSVIGELNYLLDNGIRPVNYAFAQPEGQPQRTGILQPTRVSIHNARLLAIPATLDVQGFERIERPSAVPDLEDEAQVRLLYYPEADALIREQTGAIKTVIFDHTIRIDQPGREASGLREPVRYVHNDQTERSAVRRVHDHLPPEEAEQRLLKRFAIINLWRPIGGAGLYLTVSAVRCQHPRSCRLPAQRPGLSRQDRGNLLRPRQPDSSLVLLPPVTT